MGRMSFHGSQGRGAVRQKWRSALEVNLLWNPCVGVGEFVFGANIKPFINKFMLVLEAEEFESKVDWNSYSIPNKNIRIYAEDERIIAVACYEECWLNGKNLIDLRLEEVIEITGIVEGQIRADEEYEINDAIQRVYEIDDWGAQIWIQDGRVVTVICSTP
jgi:hypothetical protein